MQLLTGRTEEFKLTLLGKIETPAPEEQTTMRTLAVPKIELLGMQKQEGEIFILPDPDTDVRIESLTGAEGSPVTGGAAWMNAEQRPLAKAVVRYRTIADRFYKWFARNRYKLGCGAHCQSRPLDVIWEEAERAADAHAGVPNDGTRI